jgi:hypothetical protein
MHCPGCQYKHALTTNFLYSATVLSQTPARHMYLNSKLFTHQVASSAPRQIYMSFPSPKSIRKPSANDHSQFLAIQYGTH